VRSITSAGKLKCVDVEVDSKNQLFSLGAGLVTHNCDNDYTEIFWNILAERANPNVEHSMIASIYGQQGAGKSAAAISMCSFMDPTFSVDNIFFNYNDLVYKRNQLKPNTAVLIDEQSQSYGLDSHRVMIILAMLKEQLRKKSIHFFFCSPTLYEESKSSMYLLEVMFVDYESSESYAALKTREGLTLGHVRIPYPLKKLEDGSSLQTKEFMQAYQAKKDQHLERLLSGNNMDIFEERAQQVMKHPVFLQAEKQYLQAMGYIPQGMLIQLINKIFPEFNAGIVPAEIAGRVKLDRELNGKWMIAGAGVKKKSAAKKK
jgi:Fe-S cluster assembly ATPase SufC